jgi:hypothetical protein
VKQKTLQTEWHSLLLIFRLCLLESSGCGRGPIHVVTTPVYSSVQTPCSLLPFPSTWSQCSALAMFCSARAPRFFSLWRLATPRGRKIVTQSQTVSRPADVCSPTNEFVREMDNNLFVSSAGRVVRVQTSCRKICNPTHASLEKVVTYYR